MMALKFARSLFLSHLGAPKPLSLKLKRVTPQSMAPARLSGCRPSRSHA